MSTHKLSRRHFVTVSLTGALASTLVGKTAQSAERVVLTSDDPMAAALAFVADAKDVDAAKNPTFKAGNDCSNCLQFKNADADGFGECALFAGKSVDSKAWCKAWVSK